MNHSHSHFHKLVYQSKQLAQKFLKQKPTDEDLSGEFVFFDTETTGLKIGEDRVIELALVVMQNKKITQELSWRFFTERTIGRFAYEIHGISLEDLEHEEPFIDKVDEILDAIKGKHLVAHNAEFDIGMMDYELRLAGRPERLERICGVSDTMVLARQYLKNLNRHRLDDVCKHLGVAYKENRAYHSALEDCRLLSQAMMVMFQDIKEQNQLFNFSFEDRQPHRSNDQDYPLKANPQFSENFLNKEVKVIQPSLKELEEDNQFLKQKI